MNIFKTKGKVIEILEPLKGKTKKGTEWRRQTFILESIGEFSGKLPIQLSEDSHFQYAKGIIEINSIIDVEFYITGTFWQPSNKWFTNLTFINASKSE